MLELSQYIKDSMKQSSQRVVMLKLLLNLYGWKDVDASQSIQRGGERAKVSSWEEMEIIV